MKPRSLIKVLSAALCVVVVGALLLGLTQRSAMPRSCSETGDPQQAVTAFFDAVCAGDFAACDSMVSGYSSIGFEGEAATEVGQKLYEQLVESYDYRLIGGLRQEDGKYVQTVELQYFDINATTEELNTLSQECLSRHVYNSDSSEIYDENGEYREDIVMQSLSEALDIVLTEPQKYYVTVQLDVSVQLDGAQWKIVMDNRLKSALLGGAV